MKNIIIKIVLLSAVLSVLACEPPEYYRMRSLIAAYRDLTEFNLSEMPDDKIISINIVDVDGYCYYLDEGQDKEKYDRLCEKHNDMSYNRRIKVEAPGWYPTHISQDFTTLEIISDMNWDAGHPAGSSLNDITMFMSVSPKKYIDSGYNNTYEWANNDNQKIMRDNFSNPNFVSFAYYYPIIKMVSELTSEDMILLGDSGSNDRLALFKFTTLPIEDKEHNITVTLTTDEGETFSATINMVFE